MSEIRTRTLWSGTLCHVRGRTENGEEILTGLLRQGTRGEPTYQGLPLIATRDGLRACRRQFREGQEVCFLGELTPTGFVTIAPAVGPRADPGLSRRPDADQPGFARTTGTVIDLAARRRNAEADLEALAGLA